MATTMTKISRRRLAVLDPAGFWRRKAVGSRASSARHHRARVCRNGDEEPTPQSLDDSLMALHLRLVLDRSTAYSARRWQRWNAPKHAACSARW